MTLAEPGAFHRSSIRLPGYDYAQSGAYFVTVCTANRECLFGEILDGAMRSNGFGQIVHEEWLRSATVRSEVELDAFVVMPNHIHGIVIIREVVAAVAGEVRGSNDCVGATGRSPLPRTAPPNAERRSTRDPGMRPPSNDMRRPRGPAPASLGAFVAGLKSATTTRINALRVMPGMPVWQRNYYEHIIRNDADYRRIRSYIQDNPTRWAEDEENPDNRRRTPTSPPGP